MNIEYIVAAIIAIVLIVHSSNKHVELSETLAAEKDKVISREVAVHNINVNLNQALIFMLLLVGTFVLLGRYPVLLSFVMGSPLACILIPAIIILFSWALGGKRK